MPETGIHLLEPDSASLRSQHKYRKRQRQDAEECQAPPALVMPAQFNRVLVDAECSHDGSVKHIGKLMEQEGKGLAKLYWSQEGVPYDCRWPVDAVGGVAP